MPVGNAINALSSFQGLAASNFPARVAYRIGRLITRLQLNPDIMAAEKIRAAAVRKFGTEKDAMISVDPDKQREFSDEYGPVASTMIDLDIQRLPVSILDHAPEMTPADMAVLEPFLEDE